MNGCTPVVFASGVWTQISKASVAILLCVQLRCFMSASALQKLLLFLSVYLSVSTLLSCRHCYCSFCLPVCLYPLSCRRCYCSVCLPVCLYPSLSQTLLLFCLSTCLSLPFSLADTVTVLSVYLSVSTLLSLSPLSRFFHDLFFHFSSFVYFCYLLINAFLLVCLTFFVCSSIVC